MKFPCTLKNTLPIVRNRFGLSCASKGLGYLAALLLLLSLLACYKLSCYQTTLLLTISALADITLLKTTCHFLPLLVGFDTLTYRKELQLIPYTCGSSKLFFGAVAGERSAFGKWNSIRKHLYSVLKFIVTCYYGKQSFEGFVRGILTSSGTTINCPINLLHLLKLLNMKFLRV
jgi:hypothetical protein